MGGSFFQANAHLRFDSAANKFDRVGQEIRQRLLEKGVSAEELVIPDDIHDFLRWESWRKVTTATGAFFERRFLNRSSLSQH